MMRKWLFQVARTTIADYWRSRSRVSTSSLETLVEAGWEGPAEEERIAVRSRPTEQIQRILQELPEKYREILTCRFLLKLSIKESVVWMGLSERNVKVVQFRLLRRAADLDRAVLGSMEAHAVV